MNPKKAMMCSCNRNCLSRLRETSRGVGLLEPAQERGKIFCGRRNMSTDSDSSRSQFAGDDPKALMGVWVLDSLSDTDFGRLYVRYNTHKIM